MRDRNGYRDGFGPGTFDGSLYIGNWSSDRPHGYGKLHGEDMYEGIWNFGTRSGNGASFRPDTKPLFIGFWIDNKPGEGSYFDENGNVERKIKDGIDANNRGWGWLAP